MTSTERITVEIAYALPEKQKIIELTVAIGTTAFDAVVQSKIGDFFPDLDIHTSDMGIFGQTLGTKGLAQAKEHVLRQGDRVEIYRPLIADPKEVRRRRAAKAKEKREDS